MAIDRMKKLSIVCRLQSVNRVNRALFELGAVEVVDATGLDGSAPETLKRHVASSEAADLQLNKIHFVLALLNEIAPEQKGFFEGLTPLPIIIARADLNEARHHFDLDALFKEARNLDEMRKHAERHRTEIRAEAETLAPFLDVPFRVADLRRPVFTRVVVGTIPRKQAESLRARTDQSESFVWEAVPATDAFRARDGRSKQSETRRDRVRILAASLVEGETAMRRALALEQFEEIMLPDIPGFVRDRVRELDEDLAASLEKISVLRERIVALTRHRRALRALEGHWEGVRRAQRAKGGAIEGQWVHLIGGYCRARDLPRVEASLRHAVPEAAIVAEDPGAGDDVPISISLPKLVKPVYMLVSLFGLPAYTAFDPSPFIVIPFYLFFGICFGDVGYGLMLIALGWYLSRKTKPFDGVHNFSQLLYYAGFSTVVFGALLGSWFGDLCDPKYLGPDNLVFKAKTAMMVLDPLADPVTMLLVALGIGACSQLYGVVLKMHGAAKNRDWQTVAFDGLLWLITLPGLVLLIGSFLGGLGATPALIGKILFLAGAFGLLLTQGRGETGILLRAVNGLVAIYGILGSYGCAAFIGDTLSYCRLLALGLTTSIVAMCVNMIGGLVRDVPYVGIVLFVAVLVAGHAFNFAISLLGAFVHSMRLIYVELFGRFYSGGSREFQPLGFDSDMCQLRAESERNTG